MTFTKLFSSITESTVWCEDAPTRLVWITMLAMADRNGRVWGSIPGLANRARVTVPEAVTALEKFLSPDPFSRTKDYEGRRIEEIEGGWRLLNHDKYRSMRDEEERRAYKADWIRKRRQEEKESESVDNVDRGRPQYTQAEAEAESDTDIPSSLNARAWDDYMAHRKELKAKRLTDRGKKMAMNKLAKLPHDEQQEVVDLSISNGWQGLFPEKKATKVSGKRKPTYAEQLAKDIGNASNQ